MNKILVLILGLKTFFSIKTLVSKTSYRNHFHLAQQLSYILLMDQVCDPRRVVEKPFHTILLSGFLLFVHLIG